MTKLKTTANTPVAPDIAVSAKKIFGLPHDFKVSAFSTADEHVPELDENYVFAPEVTEAILAGFMHNRRVLIQGYHGTGKSTHIEQVAARLNWPCVRVNLDSYISRMDLIGRDQLVLQDGKQITEFQDGIVPYALKHPVALVFDEYDAARPEVMFVIQRLLESQGKLTLLDQNRVLTPHPFFRLFATTNTVGLGDSAGIYHGTQALNQGQMDRWHIVATLNYLDSSHEFAVVTGKVKGVDAKTIKQMIAMANLTREAFIQGNLSTVMSPRTVISWAENLPIFKDAAIAFRMTFMNKCDEADRSALREMFQRCFNADL